MRATMVLYVFIICRSLGTGAGRAVVGAAGFEPATWSTQNSRATRLRYTPRQVAALSIHASVFSSKLRAHRVPDAVRSGRGGFQNLPLPTADTGEQAKPVTGRRRSHAPPGRRARCR